MLMAAEEDEETEQEVNKKRETKEKKYDKNMFKERSILTDHVYCTVSDPESHGSPFLRSAPSRELRPKITAKKVKISRVRLMDTVIMKII